MTVERAGAHALAREQFREGRVSARRHIGARIAGGHGHHRLGDTTGLDRGGHGEGDEDAEQQQHIVAAQRHAGGSIAAYAACMRSKRSGVAADAAKSARSASRANASNAGSRSARRASADVRAGSYGNRPASA
jgi:hypothetical protein